MYVVVLPLPQFEETNIDLTVCGTQSDPAPWLVTRNVHDHCSVTIFRGQRLDDR